MNDQNMEEEDEDEPIRQETSGDAELRESFFEILKLVEEFDPQANEKVGQITVDQNVF